jgi:hypothetical protein
MFQELLVRCVWFQRAWVFQEVVMAKQATAICGGHHTSWESLYESCVFDCRGLEQNSHLIHRGHNVEATKFVLAIQHLLQSRSATGSHEVW